MKFHSTCGPMNLYFQLAPWGVTILFQCSFVKDFHDETWRSSPSHLIPIMIKNVIGATLFIAHLQRILDKSTIFFCSKDLHDHRTTAPFAHRDAWAARPSQEGTRSKWTRHPGRTPLGFLGLLPGFKGSMGLVYLPILPTWMANFYGFSCR